MAARTSRRQSIGGPTKIGSAIPRQALAAPQGVDAQALLDGGLLWQGNLTPMQGTANLTLGQVQRRSAASTPADLLGKNLGYGTFGNVGAFRSTTNITLTPQVANALNALLQQQAVALDNFGGQGSYTLGLYGILPDTQQPGYYFSLRTYSGNPDVRIAVGKPGITPQVLLPGSTAASVAAANGLNVGAASIHNPVLTVDATRRLSSGKRTRKVNSYVRPGSAAFIRAVNTAATNPGGTIANQATAEQVNNFLALAGIFGLAPVYYAYGLDVVEVPNSFPTRYRLVDATSGTPVGASQFLRRANAQTGSLIGAIRAYYKANLRDGDKVQRLGPYGAANLVLRHGDWFNTTGTGNAPGDYGQLSASVERAFQAGNLGGLGLHYADGFGNRATRAGRTVWQQRDAAGNPVSNAAAQAGKGSCNLWVGGPGNSANATIGGNMGLHVNRRDRRRRNTRGEITGITSGCGAVPNYLVDPTRNVYIGGGKRALGNVGLDELLNGEVQAIDPTLTAQSQGQAYASWLQNPGLYGTNPYYVNANGFNRNLPALNGFEGGNHGATLAWNEERSNALLQQEINPLIGFPSA